MIAFFIIAGPLALAAAVGNFVTGVIGSGIAFTVLGIGCVLFAGRLHQKKG